MKAENEVRKRQVPDNFFAKKLSDIIKYTKINTKDLAQKVGRSAGTVANWKHGKGYPGVSDIALLAQAMGIHLEYFFDGDISPETAVINEKPSDLDMFEDIQKKLFPDGEGFSLERRALADEISRMNEFHAELYLKAISEIRLHIIGKGL